MKYLNILKTEVEKETPDFKIIGDKDIMGNEVYALVCSTHIVRLEIPENMKEEQVVDRILKPAISSLKHALQIN
jgi:hypothetical protein